MPSLGDDDTHIRWEQLGPLTKFYLHTPCPLHLVLHRLRESDTGLPHDHPFDARSTILHGSYVEAIYDPDCGRLMTVHRKVGDTFVVAADHIHRIVDLPEGECWSLYIPLEPKRQEPGFWRWEGGRAYRRTWNGEWHEAAVADALAGRSEAEEAA